jgi:hypothetical protein
MVEAALPPEPSWEELPGPGGRGSPAIPWPRLLAAVAALRLGVSAIGVTEVLAGTGGRSSPGLAGLLLDPWRHFDAVWFTQIAAHGYGFSPLSTAYMPIYPLLIRLAAVITGGHYLLAALLISNLSLVAAVGLIWRWTAECFSPRVAWRMVLLILVYPDAFFLVGAYSESTFLALSAGCLLALRRGRLASAGALAALATLTRLQGLVLVVPIALSLHPRTATRAELARGTGAILLPGLAFLGYERILAVTLHAGNVLTTYSQHWHIALQTPWQTIQQYLSVIRSPRWSFLHSNQYNYIMLWDLLIALFALGVLCLGLRRAGGRLTLFGLAGWSFLMTRWYSTGRYILGVPPYFLILALWATSRTRLRILVLPSLILLAFYTMQFAHNSWVD